MAGTLEGGRKAAAANKAKHGDDFYREIGRRGGSVKGIKKGFGKDRRTWWQKLLRRPSAAQIAGRVGGQRGRGTAKKKVA